MTASSALVIFGATGDLAQRMLFPSLYFLEEDGLLPEDVAIVGSARTKMTTRRVRRIRGKSRPRTRRAWLNEKAWKKFRARLSYASVDASDSASFAALGKGLEGVRELVFYLSTSPAHYGSICENLKAAGLVHGNSRVVVEKPIGHDLASYCQINEALFQGVLGRPHLPHRPLSRQGGGAESAGAALRQRAVRAALEQGRVDHVQITVAETIGVEDRWSYYDEYGAIRDMVQNHLLQLLALVAMEPPADPNSVRDEKVKVLRSLRPHHGPRRRPQHSARPISCRRFGPRSRCRAIRKKRAAAKAIRKPSSRCAHTSTIGAGPACRFICARESVCATRKSEIVMQFRDVPHSIFPGNRLLANRLIIKLQPEEEIALTLMNKTPSLERNGMELKPLALNLSLSDAFKRPRRRIAYERLLLEALSNKPTLFVRRDEGEAAWTWIDQIVSSWERQGLPPAPYASGTWGPSGAFALTERNGQSWYE